MKASHRPFYQQAATQVENGKIEFTIDNNVLVIRKATIYGAVQVLVPTMLAERLLYHSHYALLAAYPGQRRIHHSMHRKFY